MNQTINISGVLPSTAVKAGHTPRRSETGIGALMPWADRLWFVTYVAHKAGSGSGTGLFWLDDDLKLHKHEASVVGTYANRMIHSESNQCFIGPHVIDTKGNVRTIEPLIDIRITGCCRHLSDPENMLYFLGMEGEFFEVNVHSLKVAKISELTDELYTAGKGPAHFKDIFCDHGRVIVCNNSYYHDDFISPDGCDGRLAQWDGSEWTILERTQFNTLAGRVRGELGRATFALGQDRASAVMKVFLPDTGWVTYRLPKATHTQDHAWTTEWPRIREVESERWLVNASGMFYEMPAMTYGSRVWGLRPVCSHLRIIGDYCSWNGLLVMAGDQTTPTGETNYVVGQPQANLWFGKTDDLWQWGKPTGWGGPWWETAVHANQPSDPFLMTGFEHKCLHVTASDPMRVTVQIDFRGDGHFYDYCELQVDADGYAHHVFPTGLSAHWLRLVSDADTVATAQLTYT